ncbi:MAG: RdgB/HAM1 family non-canonical purine NTP pyrophosphatase [Chiayiivirga sp.]|jgi:XTP/dITP diphosphohydrolase|uniref:RdgB/HAM1 family non-canonical purine NTP pyrophosphatase n=1 Tax=Chiayiivirga sp. TaxID=2041042 RepID=UPI0025C09687|nr:RdgB/HAM1 family non-canonical purine NTP pyrophosphatase [Chiayiivirga sp.]MCI1711844.1 RdgB/HAM1 family non-canonical purine NTP pyrophosphatase [Chiayiivirga sp.]MCI1729569.1 RdgB/HAM1 family non-canonical purine NTP pyrophosphatase [Chiayiivirga sp.]
MPRLVLASGNPGKLIEMRELLDDVEVQTVSQGELGIPDAEESGATFIENAILKARHAARESGLPALGEDSGLCVDALQGAPGLYSARYAGDPRNSQANIDKLLDALRDVAGEQRSAHFYCALVLMRHADDPMPLICEGTWEGRILEARRGHGGFGYDAVFYDPLMGLSAAEMDPGSKHRVSHRGQALMKLRWAMARGRSAYALR